MEQTDAWCACERLLHDYAWTQDHGDADGFAALFAPEAVWLRPGKDPLVGHAAILKSARTTFMKSPQERGMHCITNFRLDSREGVFESTCYSIGFSGIDSGMGWAPECVPSAVLIYRNQFTEVGSNWRISRHESEFRFKR